MLRNTALQRNVAFAFAFNNGFIVGQLLVQHLQFKMQHVHWQLANVSIAGIKHLAQQES